MIADFKASVQLKRGSRNLFKLSVSGTLEGPRPLRISGKASFEIFWCDFTIRFDKTLISGEKPPLPPAVDVFAELRRALTAPNAWSTQLAQNRQHGVSLRKIAPGTDARARSARQPGRQAADRAAQHVARSRHVRRRADRRRAPLQAGGEDRRA